MCQRYDIAVKIVLSYLVEQGFSRTVRKEFRRASREFGEYLDARHLTHFDAVARDWVNALKSSFPRVKFLSFRRALALVENAARNGSVTTSRFLYDDAPFKYRTPNCYRQLLEAYIERRRQDGNGASTLRMDSIACTRFLLFLQSKDITDPAFITPEIVKDYHAQAQHRTPEGRNAYIRRIRGFIRFLASKKLVPQTLEFAFATEKARRVSIVTTLSEQQVNSIKVFGENGRSPSELRSAAMAMLALRMGLRSVDICNLCLAEISWKSRTISIVQQKTGVPLTLPFPVEVGNLLARYILEGRPRCDEPNVFISRKHPYTRLTPSSCYHSSLRILGRKESVADVRGLHVARKTFASNLLTAGNPVSTISFALGHIDDSSVDEYLATDDLRMRRCAIGLSGIECGEAFK
jgi:integrase